MKYANIGGQAVMEGVMMRHKDRYAVAVRKENHEIEVKSDEHISYGKRFHVSGIPIIRGAFAFVDSLVLGMQTLTWSASFFEDEETEESSDKEKASDKWFMALTVVLSLALSIGLFMVLPFFISNIFRRATDSSLILGVIEGLVRVLIFIAYIVLISRMKDIQRLFMYHGAEHKCINCIEHGMVLNVENVRKSSKQHKRCGTSFLIIVMMISILFFMVIRVDGILLKIISRIVLIPVIAGVSYEFLRLAGRSDNPIVNFLSKPGLWMQNMTTKEPDDSMIEVGIASVEAGFDWKTYLKETFPDQYPEGSL